MKNIDKDQRVFRGNHIFYDADIVRETELAMLISSVSDTTDETYNYWIPKSKVSKCALIDECSIIEVNGNYVKNLNLGMPKNQYFIPKFFIQKNASERSIEAAMGSGSIVDSRHEKCNQLIVK